MTIQTDDITVFLAVVREGSFGRAASSLLVSQPAISDRMARLEQEVGASLFHRSTRGAALTPAGDAFLPYAQRTVDLLDDAAATLHALDESPRLRVAVHATFAHRVVPLVLRSLGALHRSVKVRDAHSDTIIAALLDGGCDAGFVVPGARPRQLRFVALPPDPVVAVVAPTHPLAGRTATLHDLVGHRVAFNRFGTGAAEFVDRLRSAGVPEWSWTECSDAVTALHLAAQDGHVAMVTKTLADVQAATGTVRHLALRPPQRWTVPLTFAYRRSDQAEPAIAAIRSAVERLSRRRAAR
jgi:DNA-binding transcriptional LysR family regulator